MVEKVSMYGVICDNCSDAFVNFNGYGAWVDKDSAVAAAESEDWREVGDKWYCPKCFAELFDEDDDGNITRKEK